MATQLGQFNKDSYVQATDSNGVITDLKFGTAEGNAVTAGVDGNKVTFKNNTTSLSVEAALSAGTCTDIQFDTWTFDYEGGSMTKNIAFKD